MRYVVDQELELLVLIVCYRAADLTIDCLRSLEPEIAGIPGSRVVICENGTGEESVAEIAAAIDEHGWGEWTDLVPIHPNIGFAGGNNAILEDVVRWPKIPRYVLLLNADTIVRPGALGELMRAAEEHPDAGIIGPRLEWPDGTPQLSGFSFRDPLSEFLRAARTGPIDRLFKVTEGTVPEPEWPDEPDWITFACALIRREVLEACGILDPGYFLYFDDPDYCRRVRQRGWNVIVWRPAHVVHLRGRSNPVKSLTAELRRRPRYWYASRARYFAKFYGQAGLLAANSLWMLGRMVSLLRERVGSKPPHICEREWIDIWTNLLDPFELPESAKVAKA